MRFPFESHDDLLLSFILLSVPLAAFISLSTRAYSAVFSSAGYLSQEAVTAPLEFTLSFPLPYSLSKRAFGISALEILWPALLWPKMETSVALQKNATFSCNLAQQLFAECL